MSNLWTRVAVLSGCIIAAAIVVGSRKSAADHHQANHVAADAAARVQEAKLIPRKVLFGNPERAAARISPDGKYLSYLAPVDGVLNVWVGPIDDPSAAKPVTEDKVRGIRSYSWSYDAKFILYAQDKDGDENWHVYATNLADNTTRDLTPLDGVQANITAVSEKFPGEILVGINDRNPQLHDVYRINIASGERELVQKNPGFAGFVIDDDYRARFAITFTPTGGQAMLQNVDGEWKPFLEVGPGDAMNTSPAGFDKTGDILYMLDSRDRNTSGLFAMNLKSGETKLIAENDKSDLGGVLAHPTEKTLQAVAFNYTRTEWEFLDQEVEADFAKLKKVEDGEIALTSRTLDDRHWIIAFLLDDGPVKYYHFNRDSGKASYLFSNRPELEGLPLVKMHPEVISARDGLKLVCYLTLPPGSDPDNDGRPDQPVPLVLAVHGGPWARDGWGYNSTHQWLANRGYAVLSVNFRGSTGFGKNFTNAADGEWAGKMHDDLIDAVDWAILNNVADKEKVAIMGGSYGGYATLVGLTFTPEKFTCGVDIVGPSSLVTLMENVPPYWIPFMPVMKKRVGDWTSEEGRQELLKRSPLTKVDEIERPLLIAQGANDPRVKKLESDQIVTAMQKRDIPVTYVLFPDEGHGFARPQNNISFYAVTEAFLAEHLGGRVEPIGQDFDGASIEVPAGAEGVRGLSDALKARETESKN